MRLTGVIVLVIGLMIGAYCGITAMRAEGAAVHDKGTLAAEATPSPNLAVPLTFAAVAVLGGGALYFFGGRGVMATRDPAVRN